MMMASEYFAVAREREAMRRLRASGAAPPWTSDPVFEAWRFCNVRREDDRTTAWFRERVRSRLSGWRAVEATAAFRWFNRVASGEAVLDLLLGGWDGAEARRRLKGISPIVTGAYIIRGPNGMPKLDAVLWCIEKFRELAPPLVEKWGASLQSAWSDLCRLPFLGGFMSYEIVSDLRWTPVLAHAADIDSWAHAGPGCTRGLGWVVHGAPDVYRQACQEEMLGLMRALLAMSRDGQHWPSAWQPWEMREVEHWACEFDKYQRAALGAKLKRRFHFGGGGDE